MIAIGKRKSFIFEKVWKCTVILAASYVSFSVFLCVSPVELTDGKGVGGGGWAWLRIIWPQESLALSKSFNTLWIYQYKMTWNISTISHENYIIQKHGDKIDMK